MMSPGKWTADWEYTGEKMEEPTSIPNKKEAPWLKPKPHLLNDIKFKYPNMDEDWWNEDPTYLVYNMKMDRGSSPLWNYIESDVDVYSTSFGDNPPTILDKPGSAIDFIEKYSEISEISSRWDILSEFQKYISRIFTLSSWAQMDRAQHYIEMISGLDKLNSKMVKYGEDKLTITLSEDVFKIFIQISKNSYTG